MKLRKILSFIVASVLMLCASLQLKAETAVVTLNGVTTNFVVAGPIRLSSITIGSVAFTNGPVDFYDSPNAFTTNWTGAVTNYIKSVITTNLVFTNIFGVLSTNTYPVIVSAPATIAGSMKTREKVASVYAVSNLVTTAILDNRYMAYGVLISNVAGLGAPANTTVTIVYDELK
jgi:hypothetical protein